MNWEEVCPLAALIVDIAVLTAALNGYLSLGWAMTFVAGTKAGLSASEGRKWWKKLKQGGSNDE
jgi:hypothetical protein